MHVCDTTCLVERKYISNYSTTDLVMIKQFSLRALACKHTLRSDVWTSDPSSGLLCWAASCMSAANWITGSLKDYRTCVRKVLGSVLVSPLWASARPPGVMHLLEKSPLKASAARLSQCGLLVRLSLKPNLD